MEKDQLRAKKQRLAYAQKRAKELGITATEFIQAKKKRQMEMRKERAKKVKRANARFKAKVLTGEIPHTLESMTVFVELAYRDIQKYAKKKSPTSKTKEELWRAEDTIINALNDSYLKKLKTAKLLGKYSDSWEVMGNVLILNFSVLDKKAISLLKRSFKQKTFLKKFKIYCYAYYTDHTQELVSREELT